jgi:serine protease Do
MSRSIAAWVIAMALAAPVAVLAEGDDASCPKPCCQHERVVTKVLAGKGGCEGGGYMGVALREVASAELDALKLADQGAARVERVSPDSPAAKAGFKEGDVVVRFDGVPVASARQLARAVAEAAPGRRVKVDVRRGSTPMTLQVVVGEKECRDERPRELAERFRGLEGLDHLPDLTARLPEVTKDFRELLVDPAGPRRLGIRYQEITGQLARYFRVEREHALLVTHVDEGSPAEKAGLKAGDIVLGIDGKDLHDAGDLRRRVSSAENADVRLQVQRDGKPIEITVTLRSRPAAARPESTT